MRIATSTLTNMTTNSMSGANELYADIINKIASNKNFTKVSENPVDATKVLKLKDQLSQMDIYQSNIQAAMNEMDLAYDTLGAITDELTVINSKIVEAANATTTPESARAIAAEIEQRVLTIMDKMNTQYMDNYIFSGTYVQQIPYETGADGSIEYKGSSELAGDRKLTISEGTTFTYNFTGEEIFGDQTVLDVDGNKTDFFSKMKKLNELLTAPELDYGEIRKNLSVLDETTKKITQAQGTVSAHVAKLEATSEINTETITKLTEDRVNLEEVDITKAATELASAQTALQASYLIGTNVLNSVSLLDYL